MPAVLIEKNVRLAASLAAHFRSVTKGYVPFTLDWYSDPVISMAGGEDVAVDYMRNVGQLVKESGENERFFSSPKGSFANQDCRSSFTYTEFGIV